MQWTFVLLFARGLPDRRERAHTAPRRWVYLGALRRDQKSWNRRAGGRENVRRPPPPHEGVHA